MADQNTSLPVRTEADGTDERLHAKIVDGADPSKRMTVDSDLNAHVEIHGNDPANTDRVVKLSESGNVALDGFYNVTNNSNPSSNGLIAHIRNAALTIVHQIKRVTAITSSVNTDVTALDVAIRDEQGNPFTTSNPLPVTSVDSEGDEINDYKVDTGVAANASANHDYTVTALKTLKLSKIFASASGKIKAEVKVETAPSSGTFVTKFVKFNSTANPNLDFDIKELISVAAGVIVRIVITNKDNQAQDVYSTICGHEI